MKARLGFPVVVAALLLALSAVAAACGGGESPTLEEYFEQVEALASEYEEQTNALEGDLDREFASEEEEMEAVRSFFDTGVALVSGFVEGLEGVDTPADAESAHQEAVDAGKATEDAFEDLVAGLNDAETSEEMLEVFDDPDLEAASDSFTQSCLDLQAIADANNIDVDLHCGDDEEEAGT